MTDYPNADVVATPGTAAGAKAFIVTPFARLARTHVAGTIADAMVAAAFAGSLFFSLPADGARGPVLRYLVITMLPFAVLSPLIGPMIDRLKGGHRFVVLGSTVVRAILAYLLIGQVTDAGPPFFLLALCLLVGQKAYQVARSALVPSVVRSDRELVEANSKLSLLSGLSSFAGAVPAAAVMHLFGPKWSLGMATLTYLVAAGLAMQIPPSKVASAPPGEAEKVELRGAGIIMAGSAMGVLRWCVGFITLLVAFGFRSDSGVTWQLGVIGAASVVSQLVGAAAAPKLRDLTTEENLLSGALITVVVGSLLSIVLGDFTGAAVLGASIGFSAAIGKLAFDSILQRDAPDANRGRAFARFETRFQVMWVIGALVPVWLTMRIGYGFMVVEAMALFALASYTIGRMAWAHRTGTRQTAATAAALGIEERFVEVSGEVKGRVGRVGRRVVGRRGQDAGAGDHDDGYRSDHGGPDDGHRADHEYGGTSGQRYDQHGYDETDEAVHHGNQEPARQGYEPYDQEGDHDDGPSAEGRRTVVVGDEGEVVVDVETGEIVPPATPVTAVLDDRQSDDAILGDDPSSWPEPEWADSPYPWDPPTQRAEPRGAFMADVPSTVDNPYPWTPDPDPTEPTGRS